MHDEHLYVYFEEMAKVGTTLATTNSVAGGLLSLPEPEEELRPGTAMVSSRPEGEVDPIASQCRHRNKKREMRGQAKTNTDWKGVEAWGGVI